MNTRNCKSPIAFGSFFLAGILALQTLVPAEALDTNAPATQNALASQTPSMADFGLTAAVGSSKTPGRVSLFPHFSEQPTDAEICAAHVFPTALIPTDRTTPEENMAMAKALTSYLQRSDPEDASIIEDYLQQYPASAWQASLLANLGIIWRETGYFSKALSAWQAAWNLSKNNTDYRVKALADRDLGELLQIYAWVGKYETLEPMFSEITNRNFIGGSQEMVSEARQGLWIMNNKPGTAFMCGPYALAQISGATHALVDVKKLYATESSKNGFSLAQLQQLADQVGMKYQMARRLPSGAIILNSVVHWKLNHYGAVLKEENGWYLIQDSTFSRLYGHELWVSKAALTEESDGYFLIPGGSLPPGWVRVTNKEGQDIWGRGLTGLHDPNALTPKDKKSCEQPNSGSGSHGMARYSAHMMMVSLNIEDTPVGYTPPIGPAVEFTATYNQRDSFSQASPQYSNLGAQWTFNWFSYISDGGVGADRSTVWRYVSGGGRNLHNGYNAATGLYSGCRDGSILKYIASSDQYQLIMPDGSMLIYNQPSTANSGPRNMLLTGIKDAAGNTVQIIYDNQARIFQIKDAMGQTTTFFYDLSADPYKITRVQDPFQRTATFSYDPTGHLIKITDVIGMTSAFDYATFTQGNINCLYHLTTPYGTSTFSCGEASEQDNRWLIMTDPTGASELVEYLLQSGNPATETEAPTGTYNTGGGSMDISAGGNGLLNYRNTLYFDKKAYQLSSGGATTSFATIYHWLHDNDGWVTITGYSGAICSGILESIKLPLESRIWYLYPGQQSGASSLGITLDEPCVAARVVDDPAHPGQYLNQTYQYTYNTQGNLLSVIDPLSRRTTFDYYANGLDLQDVRQTTGSLNDTLCAFGAYNAQHRPATYTDASLRVYTLGWNANGQLTSVVDPKNETTQLGYDANGYLRNVQQPWSGGTKTTSLTYDPSGRVYTISDSENYTLTYQYDGLDRLTQVTYPDSSFETYQYSRLDVVNVFDRAGHRTQFNYDGSDHLTNVVDALGRATLLTWCGCGSLESITDPLQHVTTWIRDVEGRVTTKTLFDGTSTYYVFNSRSGKLQSVTDPRNQVKNFTYKIDDALAGITYSGTSYKDADGNAIVTSPVSYAYDTNYKRVTSMSDGTGQTLYTYNPITSPGTLGAGKLATVIPPLANSAITYAYDVLGRCTNRAVNGVNEGVVFDDLGRITNHTSVLGTFTANYVDATARIASLAYPNGQATIYSYFNNVGDQRLQEIWNQGPGGTTLSKFDYSYTTLGQIQKWIQQADSNPPRELDMAYDPVGQLVNAQIAPPGQAATNAWTYGYDGAGNRTNAEIDVVGNHNVTVASSVYNNVNELTGRNGNGPLPVIFNGKINKPGTVAVNNQPAKMTQDVNSTTKGKIFNATVSLPTGGNTIVISAANLNGYVGTSSYNLTVTGGGTKAYLYDLAGNLTNTITATSTNTYDWDAENQLIQITQLTNSLRLTSRFTYDGLGRRVMIVEKNNGTVTSTKQFVWCGTQLAEERDQNNNVTKRFLSEGEQIGGAPYFYTRDHLGSIREMTGHAVGIRARYDYDSYGVKTKILGDLDADFGYTGFYAHAASGFNMALYRAYDADSGRWLNRDPIAEAGGLNLYDFVGNDPINFIDPQGLLDYYYSPGGFFQPSGPVPYLEADSTLGNIGAAIYNTLPLVDNAINDLIAPSDLGTDEGSASVNGSNLAMAGAVGTDALGLIPDAKPTLSACKKALKKVYDKVGKITGKSRPSKFYGFQKGDSVKGYRLDGGHSDHPVGSVGTGPHFDYWDYTGGSRSSGKGFKGKVPIE